MTSERQKELYDQLPILKCVEDRDLRRVVERVWLKIWHESGFERLSDAKWWSVARKDGGDEILLLDHIRHVAANALRLADTAAAMGGKPDRDLLIAGALLQDVDKYMLIDPKTHAPTDIAQYTQHTFYGAHATLSEGGSLALVHMILSHSKNTTVRPKTLEAVILHYADYAVVDLRNVLEGNDGLFAEDKPKWSRAT